MSSLQRTKRLLSDFIPTLNPNISSCGPMSLEEARKLINEAGAKRKQEQGSGSRVPPLSIPQVSSFLPPDSRNLTLNRTRIPREEEVLLQLKTYSETSLPLTPPPLSPTVMAVVGTELVILMWPLRLICRPIGYLFLIPSRFSLLISTPVIETKKQLGCYPQQLHSHRLFTFSQGSQPQQQQQRFQTLRHPLPGLHSA
jgi:hypothetical protein